MFHNRPDPWLLAALAIGAGLALYQIDWGLPAAGHSWAVDALEPRTVLGILHHSFREWNSGWFYFKYPLGYPLVLGVAFAPYLAGLLATGDWAGPSATGAGFADSDGVYLALALVGRAVNTLFVLGTTCLIYGVARRLLGRSYSIKRVRFWVSASWSLPNTFRTTVGWSTTPRRFGRRH